MESLSETPWDVVIEGTGLRQSLLALALSRSSQKILHVDENEYYGGSEAAFSLQDVDEWVDKVAADPTSRSFRNIALWKAPDESSPESGKLSFSRAYTLTLSPQIIYTKSKLLSQLVSSKVYRQLEFQAVGNWWIYQDAGTALKRLPNGREDIFEDKSIDNRAKRSLMKFLKFVVDYENQTEIWEAHGNSGLPGFLASQFQFPAHLQTVIIALTLSLVTPEETTVKWALPRIARHLTSIGIFGPGFGAVVPKWGGGAEIAQVACRAGAVGGGVYVLGTGIRDVPNNGDGIEVVLGNGETVKTKYLSRDTTSVPNAANQQVASKVIAVVSSPLDTLFKSSIEGAPVAAVTVVVFPPFTIASEGTTQTYPIYVMVHSSDSGECPAGQCILYATTLHSSGSKTLLENAISTLLRATGNGEDKLLYKLYYEQQPAASEDSSADSLDLAFNDRVLQDVEQEWKTVLGTNDGEAEFMKFEERTGMNEDEDDNDNEGY